ncbi:MAG: PQQ-binding-like beta-propeller repeat protein [Chloroflexi bacterium]|nr:PQQ-binding-like beta-propeller repeat protein [Chloroflexota bacterium]
MNKIGRGQTQMNAERKIKIRVRPRLSASQLVLFLLVACTSVATPMPSPTPPLAIQAGIAAILFDERALILDQRAEPFQKITLSEGAEIIGADQQPISLLDLKDGDLVRIEGRATNRETFLAQRLVVLRAVAALPTRAPTLLFTATPSATPRVTSTPSITPLVPAGDRLPLPGTLIIADTGNNRVIEVTNDKRVIWEIATDAPDDATLAPTGNSIITNHARYNRVVEIEIASRKMLWSFGEAGVAAPDDAHLNTPASARRLSDGSTIVADTRNCRVVVIAPDKRVVAQIGKTAQCGGEPGLLDQPIGATPLANGRLLITEAGNRRVSEMDLQGKVYRSVALPNLAYPSEAQITRAGNVLLAAYEKPGRIIELAWNGRVVWEFFPRAENDWLDRPSHVIELPNGNFAFSDDYNHRVVIVNRAGRIVWQYGAQAITGKAQGYLNTPRGIDFRAVPISAATFTALAPTATRAP